MACAVVLAGCARRGSASTEPLPAGDYALESVNGLAVPCTVDHQGRSMKIKSGSFAMSADGACRSSIVLTAPNGKDVTKEVKAAGVRTGNQVSFKWEGAGRTSGEIDGTKFTMENEGMKFAYRK